MIIVTLYRRHNENLEFVDQVATELFYDNKLYALQPIRRLTFYPKRSFVKSELLLSVPRRQNDQQTMHNLVSCGFYEGFKGGELDVWFEKGMILI